jgi:hypothetical protein
MNPSFHGLIPFLSLFCNCHLRGVDSIQFLCSRAHILAGWRLVSSIHSMLLNISLYQLCKDHAENTASIVKEDCLLIRYLAMDVLLLRAFASARICLPSRCLAIGLYVSILSPFTFNSILMRTGNYLYIR